MFIKVISSCADPFIIVSCPSLCFIINFVLNSTLFYMSIVSPDFFPVTFAWNMFPSLNFQSVFFLNPFSHLCLFVGAFSPLTFKWFSTVQFSSVTQSCPTLCDSMNHSTPGLPVHHQLPSSLRLTSTESVVPSSHLILCCPLLLLPPL